MGLLRCAWCRATLPLRCRADAHTCSTRCRVALHRAGLPAELIALPRWVRHSAGKVPLTAAGAAASVTDPRTWCTYQQARASRAGVGLGLVLAGDGIVALDLDHCHATGAGLAPWAAQMLASLPPTYTEWSPSGTGLHVWGHGTLRAGRRIRRGALAVEAYATGRYLTITARPFRYSRILADLGDLDALLDSPASRC